MSEGCRQGFSELPVATPKIREDTTNPFVGESVKNPVNQPKTRAMTNVDATSTHWLKGDQSVSFDAHRRLNDQSPEEIA